MQVYLARRYFQMSPDQWFSLPWYEVDTLIDGLRDEGILKGDGDKRSPSPQGAPPAKKEPSLASASLVDIGNTFGIQTRRAG